MVQTGGASVEQGPPRVGGWGWAVVLLGWLGGLIGYLSLRPSEPRRAVHVLKWGVIFSVIYLAASVLLVMLVAVVASDDDSSSGSGDTPAASTDDGASASAPAVVEPPGPGATITGETPCPPAEGAERTTEFAEAPPTCIEPDATYTATFVTDLGDISVELDASDVPGAVNNLVVLARYGYYDDTAIFRTDPSIGIVQGGAPLTNSPSDPGPGYTIPDEGDDFTYGPGQLVMARSQGPDSTGAQYFFTVTDAASLLDSQGNYIVLGETDDDGLAVLEQVLALNVDDPGSPLGGGPAEPVVVQEVVIDGP